MVILFPPQTFGMKELEELFNRLNPNRALRLARTKKENPSQ
ncbi:hypothetical protein AMCSP04_001001 [Streptococcus pneumoniae 2070109]|nr:hypothetical protein [Streptococcus pneumoniae]EJG41244.1 hypothetical protein AMCSP04_001001 [Streptococcus pneumoniae 2070109]